MSDNKPDFKTTPPSDKAASQSSLNEEETQVLEQGDANELNPAQNPFGTGSASVAAANGLLILSNTASMADEGSNQTQAQQQSNDANLQYANQPNSSFAYYYPQALAAAVSGLDPFAAMSNQLAAVARMQPGLHSLANLANFSYNNFNQTMLTQEVLQAMARSRDSQSHGGQAAHDGAVTDGDSDLNPTKDGKYVCTTCKRAFSRLYNLKSHIRTHQNHRPYECPACNMKFTRNHDLNRHLKTHSKDRPHSCQACGRSFARRDALRRHERMDPEGKKVHCVINPIPPPTVPNLQPFECNPAVLAAAAITAAHQNFAQSQQMDPTTMAAVMAAVSGSSGGGGDDGSHNQNNYGQ
ncbi:hypothetical protein HK098_003738 [Nowakowskiella sp. JEL0407]|nr:hypothetical protein HK098_003738 [Nowakowskiella sp. JEL0407]